MRRFLPLWYCSIHNGLAINPFNDLYVTWGSQPGNAYSWIGTASEDVNGELDNHQHSSATGSVTSANNYNTFIDNYKSHTFLRHGQTSLWHWYTGSYDLW